MLEGRAGRRPALGGLWFSHVHTCLTHTAATQPAAQTPVSPMLFSGASVNSARLTQALIAACLPACPPPHSTYQAPARPCLSVSPVLGTLTPFSTLSLSASFPSGNSNSDFASMHVGDMSCTPMCWPHSRPFTYIISHNPPNNAVRLISLPCLFYR